MAVVRACMAMLPRLQAEETLLAVTAGVLGAGRLPRDEHRRLFERLERIAAADGAGTTRAVTPTGQNLRSIGIGVRRVPKAAPPPGEA